MKTSHTETQPLAVEVIDDIICNRCGGSCKRQFHPHSAESNDHGQPVQRTASFGGLLEHTVHGDYCSVSLCEACLVEMFDEWKIPPVIRDMDGPSTLEEHRAQREHRRKRNLPYEAIGHEAKAALLAWLKTPLFQYDEEYVREMGPSYDHYRKTNIDNAFQILPWNFQHLSRALADLVTDGVATLDGDDLRQSAIRLTGVGSATV